MISGGAAAEAGDDLLRGIAFVRVEDGGKIAIVRGSVACPVAALKEWGDAGGISEGAVFRPIRKGDNVQNGCLTDRSVANIVKAHAARAGLDPSSFSGHSLRAGFLTSAAKRGANLFKMMETSRHKSLDTLRGYVRVPSCSVIMRGWAALARQ